jgi:hypothetical protein
MPPLTRAQLLQKKVVEALEKQLDNPDPTLAANAAQKLADMVTAAQSIAAAKEAAESAKQAADRDHEIRLKELADRSEDRSLRRDELKERARARRHRQRREEREEEAATAAEIAALVAQRNLIEEPLVDPFL